MAQCMATLKESPQKMNQIRTQRGFFSGQFTISPNPPSSRADRPVSSQPGKTKPGKGKGVAGPSSGGSPCPRCGRLGCPGDCSSKAGPSKSKGKARAAAAGRPPFKGGSKSVGRGGMKRKLGMLAAAASPWWLADTCKVQPLMTCMTLASVCRV